MVGVRSIYVLSSWIQRFIHHPLESRIPWKSFQLFHWPSDPSPAVLAFPRMTWISPDLLMRICYGTGRAFVGMGGVKIVKAKSRCFFHGGLNLARTSSFFSFQELLLQAWLCMVLLCVLLDTAQCSFASHAYISISVYFKLNIIFRFNTTD